MTSSMSHAPFENAARAQTTKKKRTRKPQAPTVPGLRRRDGQLNTKIPARSGLMQIAKENSIVSPLLRLPAEIRNKIWAYAVGGHQVDCHDVDTHLPYGPARAVGRVHGEFTLAQGVVAPNFKLPLVCRQVYVESASLIYTHNTFAFDHLFTIDAWIRERTQGQRRIVASINAPLQYMRMYRTGKRKQFYRTFPNLQRLGIDNWIPHFESPIISGSVDGKSMLEQARERIEAEVRAKEGRNIWIDWYGKES